MIAHFGNIFTFIGGIGIFLYGMKILSEGLQKVAGEKLSNVLKVLTTNKFLGIIVGALVTAIIHSSAATTVMVVGFVNAGIMQLTDAIGVIMGANIGTTVTAWIVSIAQLGSVVEILKPEFYAPLIFGIGSLIVVFAKKEKTKIQANIFVGIGFLFLGLTLMASGVSIYAKSKLFVDAFKVLGNYPILAIITGAIVTAILSSSTASVSILQTLTMTGVVTKSAACFITVGQNIGTCITTILSSANGSKNGKRTALLHLLFNVFGGLIFSFIVLLFYGLLKDFLNTKISLVEISIFHTGFNILNTIILLPFSNGLVAITKKVIPDSPDEEVELNLSEKTLAILDERILNQPSVAIANVKKEIIFYTNYTLKNLRRATDLIVKERNDELIAKVVSHEQQIDKTTGILVEYLMKINNLALTEEQSLEVEHLMSICSDVERIGDHAENISENANALMLGDGKFSKIGLEQLTNYILIATSAVENAILAIKESDMKYVEKVKELEETADVLEDNYREDHIKRLASGSCNNVAGIVFLDVIGNLERVTDHAHNLVDYVENELRKQ